jgi:adenylosuccinate lyase
VTAYENIPLWHERDISHSSAERIILPDATMLLDYMLSRFSRIVDQLVVFEDNMKENIQKTFGLVFSQRVMLKLIDKGLSREKAYDLVQPLAMKAWSEKTPLQSLVAAHPEITDTLSEADIADAFDLNHHTHQVDTIFNRVGL